MKSFFKTIVGVAGILSLIALMVLSTLTFLFLNPKFYISNLSKPGVYNNIEKGLKISAKDTLRVQLSGQNLSYSDLSVGDRRLIDQQIDKFLTPINEKNIQDFSEKNIVNILDYINGKSESFIFYLPLTSWNLPEQSMQRIPNYLKSTNLDVFKIKSEHSEIGLNVEKILVFKNLGNKIRMYWLITAGVTLFLFLIHLSLGDSQYRFVKTGRLVTGGGILILFLAWVIKIFQNTFGQNIAVRSQASDILVGTILSVLLDSVFKLWMGSAILLIVIGFIMFNIKAKKTKQSG